MTTAADTPVVPPEKVLPVPTHLLHKIEEELRLLQPNWNKIRQFLLQAGLSNTASLRLVGPSTLQGLSGPAAAPPEWVLVDVAGSELRVIAA